MDTILTQQPIHESTADDPGARSQYALSAWDWFGAEPERIRRVRTGSADVRTAGAVIELVGDLPKAETLNCWEGKANVQMHSTASPL